MNIIQIHAICFIVSLNILLLHYLIRFSINFFDIRFVKVTNENRKHSSFLLTSTRQTNGKGIFLAKTKM